MIERGNLYAVQSNELSEYIADTGSANAYAVTLRPAISAYTSGLKFFFKAANSNTGASTIAANGLTATSIVKNNAIALYPGDIVANKIYGVAYDGTNFQLINLETASQIVLSNFFADTGNVSTNETDLSNTYIPTNLFSNNGDMVSAYYVGTTSSTANARTVRLIFNTTRIFDSDVNNIGTLPNNSVSVWWLAADIIRDSSSSVRCRVQSSWFNSNDFPGRFVMQNYIAINGLTFSNQITLRLTGLGGANNDIITNFGKVKFISSK